MPAQFPANTLSVTIDGDVVDLDITKAVISSGEGKEGFASLASIAAGGTREYTLEFEAAQGSGVWETAFDNAGSTVTYVLRPHGNAAASAEEPHYTGSCVVAEPDGDFIGGNPDKSPLARATSEFKWICTGKPVKDVTP